LLATVEVAFAAQRTDTKADVGTFHHFPNHPSDVLSAEGGPKNRHEGDVIEYDATDVGTQPTKSRHHGWIMATSINLKMHQKVRWTSKKHIPMLHNSRRHHLLHPYNPNALHIRQPAASTRTTLEAHLDRKSGTLCMPTWHRPKPQGKQRPTQGLLLVPGPSPMPPNGKLPTKMESGLFSAWVSPRSICIQEAKGKATRSAIPPAALYPHRRGRRRH
jgi:hypothetical protein